MSSEDQGRITLRGIVNLSLNWSILIKNKWQYPPIGLAKALGQEAVLYTMALHHQ